MTVLFEPFAPLFELSRGMDRLLAPSGTALRPFVPAADVVVTDDDVTVVMDVPGLKVDDLQIELVDDVLTVRGERAYPYDTGKDDARVWQRLERGFGAFERVLRVPKGLDANDITASIADGVLTLHLRKPAARQPHRIEITSGATQPALETQGEQRELAGASA